MNKRLITGMILICAGMSLLMSALVLKPAGIALAALLAPSILCNISGITFIAPYLKEKRS
ncbi:hypothetical protein GKZ89_07335 [Bacillus mangrovi]|uniref:Uncharacterized protein n=1 Tax=Metabacillus mangrovi TaxID=1491830 RepID=A0A7X2S3W1_9BACI|nr:hypothetical protein [Metabacillus mangrovi]MTH53223.1 hypothetical protein [Metabacillus mangrovi]